MLYDRKKIEDEPLSRTCCTKLGQFGYAALAEESLVKYRESFSENDR